MPEAIVIAGANGAGKTTFARELIPGRMRSWKTWNYHVSLHFIELPSEDFAVRRVAMRVAAGGHAVPEPDVRRRYHHGLALFEQVYKSLVDEWYHWFSDDGGIRLGQHQER
jgi:predicted ABC-type ATPase